MESDKREMPKIKKVKENNGKGKNGKGEKSNTGKRKKLKGKKENWKW